MPGVVTNCDHYEATRQAGGQTIQRGMEKQSEQRRQRALTPKFEPRICAYYGKFQPFRHRFGFLQEKFLAGCSLLLKYRFLFSLLPGLPVPLEWQENRWQTKGIFESHQLTRFKIQQVQPAT